MVCRVNVVAANHNHREICKSIKISFYHQYGQLIPDKPSISAPWFVTRPTMDQLSNQTLFSTMIGDRDMIFNLTSDSILVLRFLAGLFIIRLTKLARPIFPSTHAKMAFNWAWFKEISIVPLFFDFVKSQLPEQKCSLCSIVGQGSNEDIW